MHKAISLPGQDSLAFGVAHNRELKKRRNACQLARRDPNQLVTYKEFVLWCTL